MTLSELLEIVHRAYPSEDTRRCWDAKKQKVRTGAGDTLAEFIVREIVDTYEIDAPEENQLDAAFCAMRRACTEVIGVINALEERKNAHAKAS